jgi:D-inositol-3-phosphate glycosyltransferase
MKSADAVVVSTDQERDDMARLYGASPHKAEVIPPGVDTTLFRPLEKAAARRALGLKEGRIVLSVGRIEPLKGLDILIRAMARLEDPVDTRLLIVGGNPGSDPEVERLKSVAAEEGVLDVVSFTGRVDQTDLPTYYNAADVFVLSSYYETFGLVALEAMACGVPVIASRVGGPRTFIRESKTGYLIPWRCKDAYALRLDVLLANPGLRESMGKAARAKAVTMSWDEAADRMLDVYGSVIGTTWARAAGA